MKLKDALTEDKQKKVIIDGKTIVEFYLVEDVHKAIMILSHRFNYLWRDGEKEKWQPKKEEDMEGIFKEIRRCFPVMVEKKEKCPKCSSVDLENGKDGLFRPVKRCTDCGWEEEIEET